MEHRIQIGIALNTDSDPEPEVKVTPVDVVVPENVYAAAKTLQDYFDMLDAAPGNGEADIDINTKLPTIKLFGKTLSVPVHGTVFVKAL